MKTILLISSILILFITTLTFADGDHSAPATKDGAAKALEEGEFSITEKAEKRLGIQWSVLQGAGPWRVPAESVINIKFTKAAYRKFEGRITLIILDKIKKDGDSYWISSPDLQEGDAIAIKGVKFLRLTELDLFQGAVDSCG